MHYIQCTSPLMEEGKKLIQRKFKESQLRLKTATVICDAFSAILGYLRRRTGQPQLTSYFETELGTMVRDAWKEQEAIGWENILKGRLSKKWGYVQAKYYQLNPHTSDSKKYSGESWMRKTVKALLQYTLGMWNTRCKVLHGENETEQLKKRKEAAVMQVRSYFAQTGDIIEEFQYLFDEGGEVICGKTLQYILK